MKLIVGLGNPGSRYAATRHNIGFRVVEAFAAKFRIVFDGHEKDAFTGSGRVAGGAVMVAKPQTYMNLSGESVAKLARAHLESLADLIVVYDDIDLPVGKLRIREKGSAGTHNGMRSIVSELGSENFARLRFGVRGATIGDVDLADYVLDAFTAEEERTVADVLPRALDALVLFARGDLRRAMNTFNRDAETEEAKSE
ncbi:MAG: aminoacyl-tRNA hydrolase [Thermoanaerobaculia bacterium]